MGEFSFLLALGLAGLPQIQAEVRNSEVWVVRDGYGIQLTHDGKAKLQAALSPSRDRVAYYEECPESEHCTPTVVILDLEGHRLISFAPSVQAVPPGGPCGSILRIVWVGNSAMGAECHLNPSLSEYVETDLSTGRTTRDLLGYGFTPSPNGKLVAHVGWIPHFASPPQQSNYLQVDHKAIYPLPQGMKPVMLKPAAIPPNVVEQQGLTYSAIHEFDSKFVWSPDSEHIALVDCTFDWTANTPTSSSAGDGEESNRRCFLAAVSVTGEAALFPLLDFKMQNCGPPEISWCGRYQIALRGPCLARTFKVP